jgi:hypothetical protein
LGPGSHTPPEEKKAHEDAEDGILKKYQTQYPGILDMKDLRLAGRSARNWQAHHLHEHSWGGNNDPKNFQWLPLKDEHSPLTNWWKQRHERIQQALFGYQP